MKKKSKYPKIIKGKIKMKQFIFTISLMMVLIFTSQTYSQLARPARPIAGERAGGDTSCGIVWYPSVQLSPDLLERAQGSQITVQGDTVHISWEEGNIFRFPYLRSVDGGKTFEELRDILPDSLTNLYNRFLLTNGGNLYGGFTVAYGPIPQSDKCFLLVSTDRGATWSDIIPFPDSTHYIRHSYAAYNDTLVFINTRKSIGWHFAYTLDKGLNWVRTPTGVISHTHDIAMTSGEIHFVKGYLFDSSGHQAEFVVQYRKSTDLGFTWSDSINLSSINSRFAWSPIIGTNRDSDSPKIAVIWTDGKYGCLSMGGCSVMERHLDLKDSVWSDERVMTPEPRGGPDDVAIYKSTIAVTWTMEYIYDYVPYYVVYVSISKDGGKTWSSPYNITGMFGYAMVSKVAVSGSTIHVVWGERIGDPFTGKWKIFYRRGEILPLSVENKNTIPTTFGLNQNYPNPFNSSTIVNYQLSIANWVTLKIYDVFGREVTTLVSENKQPGEYEVEWNPSTSSEQVLSSGVYFIRMNAGNYFATKKAILMK